METSHRNCNRRLCRILLLLCLTMAALLFTQCDAKRSMGLTRKERKHSRSSIIKSSKKLRVIKHDGEPLSNTGTYGVNSPFSLPPFDSLAPYPLPENAPPYCIYPPFTPEVPQGPPSTTIPSPIGYTPTIPYIPPILPIQSPPPSPTGSEPSPSQPFPTPSPPESTFPSPPEAVPSPYIYIPSPSGPVLSPPYYEPSPPSGSTPSPPSYVPSPIGFVPSPPSSVPSPTGFVPSPPVFQPPIVFPPPTRPPSPKKGPNIALWCVAKPSVPDPIIQEAMNYACGSGADCDTIQSNGPCFEPNTVYAHASYAFNSYWQRTKVAGGTCSFGGTAMLVTVDPSHDGCHFVFY